jgi:hypothetical protein
MLAFVAGTIATAAADAAIGEALLAFAALGVDHTLHALAAAKVAG